MSGIYLEGSRDTDNKAAMYNCWWTNKNEPMKDLLFSSTNMAAMTYRENHLSEAHDFEGLNSGSELEFVEFKKFLFWM